VTVTIPPELVDQALKLTVPVGLKRPDAFYAQVADLYSRLAAGGVRGPAARIAKANDLPVTTVHRWVKEARNRGLLSSGRTGRVG
jgi:transposase-like protein